MIIGDVMQIYIESIISAILIFPFFALLFTTPYVLYQYHKFGSIPSIRVMIVYSFILYMTCSYFLVILPLPKIEEVSLLSTPRYQLIPFQFVKDIIRTTNISLNNIKTYWYIFKEPFVYQALYNVLLTIPFGVYLRYYFKCNFKKTFFYSFLLSLFFELTQLSGLYGIYPRGYRLFDVDDLLLNTLGGIFGYLGASFLTFLPSRDKIDEISYKRGREVSGFRRILTFLLDFAIFFIFGVCFTYLGNKIYPISTYFYFIISIFIYYTLIPYLLNGQTLIKLFLNSKVERIDGKKVSFYQLFIRTFFLFLILLAIPFYVMILFRILIDVFPQKDSYRYFLLGGFCFTELFILLYYFYCIVSIFKRKALLHEKVSKTRIISTIFWKEEKEELE